jgi:transcription factor C subunit 7
MINQDYTSTIYASREGELLRGIQDRADLFAEAWPARIEAEMPDVKSAVVFSHAATVIALGRAVSQPLAQKFRSRNAAERLPLTV